MAEVKVLVKGFTSADSKPEAGEKEKTCATISLIIDGYIKIIVDPGILKDKNILINALKKEGLDVKDINYVALTHSHADHFRNIGLFPNAKLLEFFGIWHEDTVEDWKEDFTENIKIIKTPGHSNTGISFVVNTSKGKVAVVGDVFWKENHPKEDPYAECMEELRKSRQKILKIADWIVPGHADIFKVKK
ncbi:MAG: MBL fold metallo-hydrolase [Nanoarchaeota archaeon]|nr:MBL fold metallo-hydrolase [Nanoarchaeota archaeon]MBU4086348.1 MBL fold metallo-hydrolase [Nanoarchaeota archaeon]